MLNHAVSRHLPLQMMCFLLTVSAYHLSPSPTFALQWHYMYEYTYT